MTSPLPQADMIDPNDSPDSTAAADNAEPMDSTDPKDPIEPIEHADPTLPIDNTEFRDPMDSTDPDDHNDNFDSLMSRSFTRGAPLVAHRTRHRSHRGPGMRE